MFSRMRSPILGAGFLLLGAAAACAPDQSTSERAGRPAATRLSIGNVPAPADTAGSAFAPFGARPLPAATMGGAVRATGVADAVIKRPSAESGQAPASSVPVIQQDVTPGSMLVRVGNASLQVDSLEIGIARIRDVARRTSAVIANTSMEGGRERTRAATLELRIPSQRFDDAVNGLSPIGKLESVNVSVEDVGEEFVDVQARMVNARRLEQRLIDLLANRTGKLADVLSIEHELARVREEIERYEGRLRYLRTRASVSTLSISVHEPYPVIADHPGANPMRDAFVQAWRNLVAVTAAIIASLGVLIPLGLIVGAVVLIGRRAFASRFTRSPKSAGVGSA